MNKTIRITTALLLILALCLSFAACGSKSDNSAAKDAETVTEAPTEAPKEPGVKVGDTFTYGDFVLTVEGIAEGSEGFDEAGTPEGKFVTISFSAELTSDEGSFGAEKSSFAIDGKEAVDATATMHLENGAMTPGGIVALFDVDADADPDYLHLVVSN